MNDIDLNNAAKETYGITLRWKCTGYLMADGTQLNFSEDGGYSRTQDHRNVEQFFNEELGTRYDYVVKFMNAGNIRICPESGIINLTVLPTNIQFSKIKDFIRFMEGDVILEITNPENGDSICYIEYKECKPLKLIMDIKRYFIDRIIPQETLYETYNSQSNELSLKRQQLIQILKNNPIDDTLGNHTWIRKIEDIFTYQEAINNDGYDEGYTPDYTLEMIYKALKTGYITVYSSYPIKPGIFVTPSKMEASSYAGNNKIYKKYVKLIDIAWIDGMQGQYAPIKRG